jgi:DNA-3-methyladenine glycosylase
MEKANRKYFEKDTLQVANNLLGDFILRKNKSKILKAKIIETEAYIGPQDQASHTRNNKKTKRNKVVWSKGGHIYTYLSYGIHWMLNIVTEKKGVPECVLIRALDIEGFDLKKSNGPGKLTKRMGIDKTFYGEDLTKSDRVWIEKGNQDFKVLKTARINIDSAGEPWVSKDLRFLIKEYQDQLPKP